MSIVSMILTLLEKTPLSLSEDEVVSTEVIFESELISSFDQSCWQ